MLHFTQVTSPAGKTFISTASNFRDAAIHDFKAQQNRFWAAVAFTGFIAHIKDFPF